MAETSLRDRILDAGIALSGDFATLQRRRESRDLADLQRQQQQQQRRTQLSEERQRAQALDFREISNLVDVGETDLALARINDRLRVGTVLPDFDPSSTQFVKSLLEEGDTERAKQVLGVFDEGFVNRGLLEARAQPEVIPASQLTESGQIVSIDPVTRDVSAQQIPGFTGAKKSSEAGLQADSVPIFLGGFQVIDNKGNQRVTNAAGQELLGDEAIDFLARSRQAELDFELAKTGAREAGRAAIKQSAKAFEDLRSVDRSIENLQQGIEALDAGAQTGPIISRLPSVRAASIELDNIQSRLGLDVIHNTTFGSLSEAELAFALSSALPQRLDEPDLRRWLESKRDAQRKLRDYIEGAAIFLGIPGNTVTDFISQQKELRNIQPQTEGASSEQSAVIQRLRFDAQGNPI